MGLILGGVVIGCLGAAYAAVPLYRAFCQATGFGGTTQRGETVSTLSSRAANLSPEKRRHLTVYFHSEVTAHVPWRFVPLQRSVSLEPGESVLSFFNATNNSDEAIIGVATYNVAPSKAGIYFHKIQCFCFDEQRLEPRESVDMPVFFYIDPEFLEDPRMDDIDHITLSYTFFNAHRDDVDAAFDEAFRLLESGYDDDDDDDDDDEEEEDLDVAVNNDNETA
jgi:cytochrome c oxidase assembly protein subunit 11